jgi:lysozyme family protein
VPVGLDYVVVDGAFNCGPAQSLKWLQRALSTLKVDGALGEATLAAIGGCPDHYQLIALMLGRRLAFTTVDKLALRRQAGADALVAG